MERKHLYKTKHFDVGVEQMKTVEVM